MTTSYLILHLGSAALPQNELKDAIKSLILSSIKYVQTGISNKTRKATQGDDQVKQRKFKCGEGPHSRPRCKYKCSYCNRTGTHRVEKCWEGPENAHLRPERPDKKRDHSSAKCKDSKKGKKSENFPHPAKKVTKRKARRAAEAESGSETEAS